MRCKSLRTAYFDLDFKNLVFSFYYRDPLKKYVGTNTDVSAFLTPSTYDLFAASVLYVNVARLIFF